jgi:hypothetical protein
VVSLGSLWRMIRCTAAGFAPAIMSRLAVAGHESGWAEPYFYFATSMDSAKRENQLERHVTIPTIVFIALANAPRVRPVPASCGAQIHGRMRYVAEDQVGDAPMMIMAGSKACSLFGAPSRKPS